MFCRIVCEGTASISALASAMASPIWLVMCIRGGKENPENLDKWSREGWSIFWTAVHFCEPTLKKVGLMDERYFMYFEDLDYCKRVKRSGLKVYYYPEAEIIHSHGISGKGVASDKDQWRRLIPGSKIYHGPIKHYLIYAIAWLGQKWQKLLA